MLANSTTSLTVHVDGDIKNKAQEIYAALGIDMATAINIFLMQSISDNGMPFEATVTKPAKTRQFGRMKGKMWMADDWDVSLDDLKEYM